VKHNNDIKGTAFIFTSILTFTFTLVSLQEVKVVSLSAGEEIHAFRGSVSFTGL
jgi:hypothetical protein